MSLENTLIKHGEHQADFAHVDVPNKSRGMKLDAGKRRYALMPRDAERAVVDVLTYGAQKYDDHNWRFVPDLTNRYYSAMRRHVDAFLDGQRIDSESGHHHLAHAVCCLLFILQDDILQHETKGDA